MNPEDRSKIDELKKSLYSRNAPDIKEKRRLRFSETAHEQVPTDWEHPPEEPEEVQLNNRYQEPHMSFVTKLFLGSLIFFICAVGVGAAIIWNGKNIISANNIDISINGQATVSGGDPLNFGIDVANKNNVTLQAVDLQVDFPTGTVDATDRSKELHQVRQTIADIKPGGKGDKNISAVLYGEENSKKQIQVSLTYHVAGSNAVFKKTKTYDVLISSSPLSLNVNSFKEVTSGQEFGVEVTLASNSSDVIKNLLLRAEFPFGFTLTSTDVQAEGNTALWKIGDIPPHGKKVVRFKGVLEGQDGESRVFRLTAGAQSVQNPSLIATEYIASTQDVSIQKPFISTAIAFDSDSDTGDATGSFNTPVKATMSWFNNLTSAITDAELDVKISGNAFDKFAVTPGVGYYKSSDNEITWNKITTEAFNSIGAGENGSVNFSFTPHNFSTPSKGITNPSVTLDVSVSGKRLSESNVPEEVKSSAKRTIKISSNLSLASTLFRTSGPFENTGPIPPQAETQTTYTVTWTVDNTANTVSGAEVKALLPVYTKWLGKVSPGGEDLVHNANGEIVWKVGNIDTFTQMSGHSRTVSFQIAVEPPVTQIGQVPILLQDTSLSGIDDFTGVTLTATQPSLTTRFSDGFKDGQDIVVGKK
jgi:hypothetical protein